MATTTSSAVFKSLGLLTRQAMCSGAGKGLVRQQGLHTEIGGRYSPRVFGRETPIDRSSASLPKNPFIEAFVHRRNKLDREFAWNLRTVGEAVFFLGGIAYMFFEMSILATRTADASNGYPKRNMFGAASSTGFVLPDEREWY